ncbi:MAG: hypothetical protein K6B73_00660 [Treponema sp.]|nr:hypothetical protein [Treponema sp.]
MSTCPEKDLHSVYLDGELPQKFIPEYEAHVNSCPKCREQLSRLRSLRSLLNSDELPPSVTQDFLDKSFERLQTKLRYSQTTSKTSDKNPKVFSSVFRWAVPFAAAAVFALIFIPLQLRSTDSNKTIQAIARTEATPKIQNEVVVDGNIDKLKVSQVFKQAAEEKAEDSTEKYSNQKVISATNLASTGKNGIFTQLNSVDVFRPDFKKSAPTVRIEVPDMHTIPMKQAENLERR